MATFLKSTSVNSAITLDPVQGLVDYVLDIKPYHTKILEVLIEYIHTDPINVTVLENVYFKIDFQTLNIQPVHTCGYGISYDPLIVGVPYAITSINAVNNYFVIAGDHTTEFPYGYPFSVTGTGTNDQLFHVLLALYNGSDTLIYTTEDVAPGGTLGILQARRTGYDDPTFCALEEDSGMYAGVVVSERINFSFGEDTDELRLSFADTIYVDRIVENQAPGAYDSLPFGAVYDSLSSNGDILIGGFDLPMWDVGGFDENIMTLSNLYNNTF